MMNGRKNIKSIKSSVTRQSTGCKGLKQTKTQFALKGSMQTFLFPPWRNSPAWTPATSLVRFRDRTQLDASSLVGLIWMRDQAFTETPTWTTHNIHKIQTSVPPTGFEPAIPASEWPPGSASVQTYQYEMDSKSTEEEFSRWSVQADLWEADTLSINFNFTHCTILNVLASRLHRKCLRHVIQLLHQTLQYKGIW